MAYYRLALCENGGSVIEDDVLARTGIPEGSQLSYSNAMNDVGSIDFSLPLDDPFVTQANFAPLERELLLYREETLVWGGRLLRWQITGFTAVRFGGSSFLWTLDHREVVEDQIFNNVDQLTIAWNLISTAQGKTDGDMGITLASSTPSGVTRSIAYCMDQRDVVGQALRELAGTADGFDFDVGPDKVWRTWHPYRTGTSSITLDAATNVADFAGESDGTSVANQVAGVKSAGNCDTPVVETDVDTTARAAYGLLQANVTDDRVSAAHLFSMAQDELRITKAPRRQIVAQLDSALDGTPDLSEYELGDVVHVQASRGFATWDEDMRIIAIAPVARPGERELVSVTLDSVLVP